ncbi:hypothetical protein FPOAC2_10180 [Fusarium poae]
MSSNKDQITHLGSELENLHIPKQTEEHHNNNRTADAISIPDPSGSSGSRKLLPAPVPTQHLMLRVVDLSPPVA